MDHAFRTTLEGWDNFCLILGGASGALTGLTFVTMAIIADTEVRASGRQIAAFGTPTVVLFIAPLIVSVVLCAPWRSPGPLALTLAMVGAVGTSYTAIATWLVRRQREYLPESSDWIWFSVFPLLAYAALIPAALWMRTHVELGLFGIAADSVALLLIALHNAWDTVTYLAVLRRDEAYQAQRAARHKT